MHKTLIAAAAFAALAGSATAAETETYDVTFLDTILTQSTEGLSLGDRFILNDLLLKDGKEVGYNSGVCTITDVQGIAICNITFVLPEGTVSIQFVNSPPPLKTFGLFGGTGAHASRSGSGELLEHGDGTGKVTFNFD
jgi:hypothetical protein